MSDFRCKNCNYEDSDEWRKICAKTFPHQIQELAFMWNGLKSVVMGDPKSAAIWKAFDIAFFGPERRFINRGIDKLFKKLGWEE